MQNDRADVLGRLGSDATEPNARVTGGGFGGGAAGLGTGIGNAHRGATLRGRFGVGAGGTTWEKDGPGRTESGATGAMGGRGHLAGDLRTHRGNVAAETSPVVHNASGRVRRYETDDGGRGYDVQGTHTPLGASNTRVSLSHPSGASAVSHADDIYLHRTSVEGGVAEGADGTQSARGRLSHRTGMDGAGIEMSPGLGKTRLGVDHVSQGTSIEAQGKMNRAAGRYEGHVQGEEGVRVRNLGGEASLPGYESRANVGDIRVGQEGNVDAELDTRKGRGSLRGNYSGGGLRARNIDGSTDAGGIYHGEGHIDEINSDSVTVRGAEITAERNKLNAGVERVEWGGPSLSGARTHTAIKPLDTTVDTHIGNIGNSDSVDNARLQVDREGGRLGVDKVSVGGWSGENIGGRTRVGNLGEGEMNVGSFSERTFEVNDAHLDTDWRTGVHGGSGPISYDTVRVKDVDSNIRLGNGLASHQTHIGDTSVMGGEIARTNLDIDRRGLRAGTEDTHVSVLRVKDYEDTTQVGAAHEQHGARDFRFGSGQIDKVDADLGLHEGHILTQGNRLDILGVDDAHLRMKYGDQQLLDANTSFNAGTTMDEAGVRYKGGRIQAGFKDAGIHATTGDTNVEVLGNRIHNTGADTSATATSQTELDLRKRTLTSDNVGRMGMNVGRTDINALGYDMSLPEAEAELAARARGELNASRGTARGELNLTGGMRLGNQRMELGDWARASGEANLRRGTANVNLGGEHGVGGDVNLRSGDVNVNAFGRNIDVDETARHAVDGARRTAGDAYETARRTAAQAQRAAGQAVDNARRTASRAVDRVSRAGRDAWNRLTDW